MGNLKGIVPWEMGAILSCYPCPDPTASAGQPPCNAVLHLESQPGKGSEEGKPFPPLCLQPVTLPLSLSHFKEWAPPPFFKASICIQAGEESQRSGAPLPIPGAHPPLGSHVLLCLSFSHVSAISPLQDAVWRVGDLLPTVTGLWDSDYLAYRFMV